MSRSICRLKSQQFSLIFRWFQEVQLLYFPLPLPEMSNQSEIHCCRFNLLFLFLWSHHLRQHARSQISSSVLYPSKFIPDFKHSCQIWSSNSDNEKVGHGPHTKKKIITLCLSLLKCLFLHARTHTQRMYVYKGTHIFGLKNNNRVYACFKNKNKHVSVSFDNKVKCTS